MTYLVIAIVCILFAAGIGAMLQGQGRNRPPSHDGRGATPHEATEAEEAIVSRYNDLYDEVPLSGGKEWRVLDIDALTKVHADAIGVLAAYHDTLPERIMQQMIGRAESLANWMVQNQHRRFYADSDMRSFIEKPRAVATNLSQLMKS